MALGQSHTSELVAAPSVAQVLGELAGEARSGGCTCLTFPLPVSGLWTDEVPFPDMAEQRSSRGLLANVSRRGPQRHKKPARGRTVKDLRERVLRRGGGDDYFTLAERVDSNSSATFDRNSSEYVLPTDLEEVLRFMPEFVKHRMFASRNTQLLAEHRYVSVLFIIGSLKVQLRTPTTICLNTCLII